MKRRDLEQAFSRYGQVKSLDYTNGEPIAIVSYNEIEDAIKARGKMTGVTQFIDGKKVRADSGQSDSSRRGKTNEIFCFIKNSICLLRWPSNRLSRSANSSTFRYRSTSR